MRKVAFQRTLDRTGEVANGNSRIVASDLSRFHQVIQRVAFRFHAANDKKRLS